MRPFSKRHGGAKRRNKGRVAGGHAPCVNQAREVDLPRLDCIDRDLEKLRQDPRQRGSAKPRVKQQYVLKHGAAIIAESGLRVILQLPVTGRRCESAAVPATVRWRASRMPPVARRMPSRGEGGMCPVKPSQETDRQYTCFWSKALRIGKTQSQDSGMGDRSRDVQ